MTSKLHRKLGNDIMTLQDQLPDIGPITTPIDALVPSLPQSGRTFGLGPERSSETNFASILSVHSVLMVDL